MKIQVTFDDTNALVRQEVVRVFSVAPFGLPDGITEDIFTAKGQLIGSSAAAVAGVINAPGSNNQVLVSDNGETLGFKWGTYVFTGTLAEFNAAVSDADLASLTGAETLTNKRVTPRVGSATSSATPTINTDNVDAYSITALATAITSFTTNLSGTPTNFQKLIIRIKDNGTARAITWGSSFKAKGVALPTTTVISKVLTVGFIYDSVTSKWGCVASVQEA